MKPAPFRYIAPHSLDEALAALQEHGYDAKLLAGGQSLIPTMNFRLAQPGVLVDLNRLSELSGLSASADGGLLIGAMCRQRTVERSALVLKNAPLLHAVMPWIAHVQIRNRGTIGGSLAHADPAAELPAIAVALNASLRIRSLHGERTVLAEDFYVGLFTTDLAPDEILVEVKVPPMQPGMGWGFDEFARRRGDYAIAGAAAVVQLDPKGHCTDARLVYLSVGEGPVRAIRAAAALHGAQLTPDHIAEAARIAASQDIEPLGDIHATAEYRRHLAEVLGRRVLTAAFERARASQPA